VQGIVRQLFFSFDARSNVAIHDDQFFDFAIAVLDGAGG
jgi:hypothetical protein